MNLCQKCIISLKKFVKFASATLIINKIIKTMKKIFLLIIAIFLLPTMYVQAQSDTQTAEMLAQIETNRSLVNRYKLYPILNSSKEPTSSFVSLDTQTGKVDLICNDAHLGEVRIPINTTDLTGGNGKVSDLFELAYTFRTNEFILYCKVNGAAWYLCAYKNEQSLEPILQLNR